MFKSQLTSQGEVLLGTIEQFANILGSLAAAAYEHRATIEIEQYDGGLLTTVRHEGQPRDEQKPAWWWWTPGQNTEAYSQALHALVEQLAQLIFQQGYWKAMQVAQQALDLKAPQGSVGYRYPQTPSRTVPWEDKSP